MNNKDKVYDVLKHLHEKTQKGITAEEIADRLKIQRSNISNYLNQLCKEDLAQKIKSRPVYFIPKEKNVHFERKVGFQESSFSTLIGKTHSLKKVVEKAKASILYPPYGLHSVIYGETGVGKSMLAKYMYDFSIEAGVRKEGAPFVTFNCADYANNPQLLMGHVFGVEKGAYTGAESSKIGLLEWADGGVLFLDEIHRLPPEGQEMLFTFIDKGTFKRMGQSTREIESEVLIIAATTENPESTLLDTFNRRIPMTIEIPPLRERSMVERIELVKHFFRAEARKVGKPIKVHRQTMKSLLLYQCRNNVGQLQSDIKLAVANSYVNCFRDSNEVLDVHSSYFNESLNERKGSGRGKTYEVEILVPKDMDYYMFHPSGKEENFTFKEVGNQEDHQEKAKPFLVREGIRDNKLIEKLFMDAKFFKLCENVRQIIENELGLVLGENKFCSMATLMNSIIEGTLLKSGRNKLDMNEVRQNNKEEFRAALRIISSIESEYNMFISLEEVACVALFLVGDHEDEGESISDDLAIVVAMHGDSTASSMVKAVKEILGAGNICSFDMKLNKSYKEVVEEFKETVKSINAKEGVLLFTDMGSLNSFDSIIKQELKLPVKTMPMVTTLMVLEALQKANTGFSLIEVYDSIVELRNNSFNYKTDTANDRRENVIIVGYGLREGVDKESRRIIRDNLDRYLEDVEIELLPYESEQDFQAIVSNQVRHKNVIAVVSEFPLASNSVECIDKSRLESEEAIERLKTLVKINKGYYDIIEGLKSSLKHTSYSKVFEDTRAVMDAILSKLHIRKEYDMVIGLAMHVAFMIDSLVGDDRTSEKFPEEKLDKHREKLDLIKKEMTGLERRYKIHIDHNECYGILSILCDNL